MLDISYTAITAATVNTTVRNMLPRATMPTKSNPSNAPTITLVFLPLSITPLLLLMIYSVTAPNLLVRRWYSLMQFAYFSSVSSGNVTSVNTSSAYAA